MQKPADASSRQIVNRDRAPLIRPFTHAPDTHVSQSDGRRVGPDTGIRPRRLSPLCATLNSRSGQCLFSRKSFSTFSNPPSWQALWLAGCIKLCIISAFDRKTFRVKSTSHQVRHPFVIDIIIIESSLFVRGYTGMRVNNPFTIVSRFLSTSLIKSSQEI